MPAHDCTPPGTEASWYERVLQSAKTAVAEAGVAVQLAELKQAISGSSPELRLEIAEAWLHLGRLTQLRDALTGIAPQRQPAPEPTAGDARATATIDLDDRSPARSRLRAVPAGPDTTAAQAVASSSVAAPADRTA